MMAKNEADIIGDCLDHWFGVVGADRVYLCDNSSTDGTVEIARKYPGVYLSHDHADSFDGERIVNGLIRQALNDGFNWIFPADADEFLITPSGQSLSGYLQSLPQRPSYAEIPYFNIWPNGKVTMQTPQKKVFGYFDRQMRVSIGNHQIIGRANRFDSPLKYDHYQFRSYTQMRKKILEHGAAFESMGLHDNRYAVAYRKFKSRGEPFFVSVWHNLITGHEPIW